MRISRVIATTGVLLITAAVAAPGMQRAATTVASSSLQVDGVTANLEHGRYLVEQIAHCVECHSPRDENGNIIEAREFDGGPIPFKPPWPGEWAFRAPRNRGLPGYDDGQAMRLLTQGAIGREGQQLKPPMPRFHMSRQDAADVIVYMRSLR